MNPLVTSTSTSHSGIVVASIRRMISDGELHPGDRLPIEPKLAEQLGVSRGSLREGVRALSSMGVLETRQGSGTFVTDLDAELLLAPVELLVDLQRSSGAQQVHSVRRVLETDAAGRAAVLIDEEQLEEAARILDRSEVAIEADIIDHEVVMEHDIAFHAVIGRASGNDILAALISALSSRTVRGRLWRAISDEAADANTLREHREILDAIRAGDPDAARIRMAAHLLAVESFLDSTPPPRSEN
ncbi:FadR/GntR family transcriptional regulator [Agromyces sp. NPDC058104]|uniref:FadR/GntR family transcriptional regulator n=1 Tax=Agromyces sp. NPDC058104 TaxID=3346342 RepID=UPI0036DEBBAF